MQDKFQCLQDPRQTNAHYPNKATRENIRHIRGKNGENLKSKSDIFETNKRTRILKTWIQAEINLRRVTSLYVI
jgi:hypothetical protein